MPNYPGIDGKQLAKEARQAQEELPPWGVADLAIAGYIIFLVVLGLFLAWNNRGF